MANKNLFGNTNVYSATSMAFDMLDVGVKDGYLPSADTFPNIPELMTEARKSCLLLFNDINRWNNEENPKKFDSVTLIDTVNRMSFYVGMGAVYLWNSDWDSTKKNGVYKSVCAPRGYFYLDEYVMHLAGAEFGSEEGKALSRHNMNARKTMYPYLGEMKNSEDMFAQLIECMMAMYYYGMVVGMSNLGMH